MKDHSGDPAEPFTCEKHRGIEARSSLEAFAVLLLCPECNARFNSIIDRTSRAFTDIMATLAPKK